MAIKRLMTKRLYDEDPTGFEVIDTLHSMKATDIRHHYDCPHYHDKNAKLMPDCIGCKERGKFYMQTSHAGQVLLLTEKNGHDDSDFMAHVWEPELNKVSQVLYGSTRGWTYANSAVVDASPQYKQAAHIWRLSFLYAKWLSDVEVKSRMIEIGRKVRVVSGKYQGGVGEVTWVGKGRAFKTRVRIKAEQSDFFVDRCRCRVQQLVSVMKTYGDFNFYMSTVYHEGFDEMAGIAHIPSVEEDGKKIYNEEQNQGYIDAQVAERIK